MLEFDIEFWSTFGFTILNILILFFALKKILFGRLTEFMEARSNKIQETLDNAEETKKMIEEMKVEYDEKLKAARFEGQQITAEYKEMAQKEFLYSSRNSNAPTIGMVLDGCWFNAEVDEAYTDMVNGGDATASKQNRKIGFMPIPKATPDKVGETLTMVDTSRSVCFINAKVSGATADVAKLFLKFFHTNESLATYTEKTDATRPYKYTVDETKITHFGRTMMDIHNNANVIYTYSNNETYLKNSQIFDMDVWSFSSTNGNSNPFHVFRDKSVSVETYFKGMYTTTKATIEALMK